MIKAKNLSKSFLIREDKKDTLQALFVALFNQGKSKKFKAVNNVNFEIKKGEFVGIIGKNGSGKSTLLKIIAGIYSPDKGSELRVKGKIVPFLELGVGFNSELTGKENVYLNGTILGMSKKFIEEKFEEIVEFSGLGEFIHTPVKNYSSGMKVRLAFSIAMQADGDIYILDEILGVGDGAFRAKSIAAIKKLVEQGKTIIYVSHSLGAVKKYCDRVIWLNDGKVIFDGDTYEGIEQYRHALLEIEKQDKKKSKDDETPDIVPEKVYIRFNKELPQFAITTRLKFNKPRKDFNVRFDVYQDGGTVLFSSSTEMSDLTLDENTKSVGVLVKDVNFANGDYLVDILIYGENEKDIIYQEDKATAFIRANAKFEDINKGLINLDNKWMKDE